ncbi:hypothetical protein ACTIVE_6253 [Actinomadura verrucosospora]|uniref:Uncharacterized protein n=1 Tax=Actinomadura verrucosospora TaxID=46165 RepID=A0A7D4A3Z1_ACTVE|nr:hypothetical protein ACTIVE_6253 [Actinomadura verrucosospora]
METSPQIVRSRSAWAFLILLISAFFIVVAVSSTDGRWIVGVFGVVFLFLGTSTLTNHVVVADRLLFRKNLFGLRTRQIHLDRLRSVRFEPATRQGPVLDLADHQDQIRLLNKDCKINELLSVLKPYLDSAPMDEASRKEIARKLA